MTVIAARVYREGRLLSEVDLSKPIPTLEKKEDFIWIGLHDPDAATIKTVQQHFGLHELAVEDALDPRHLPKMENYGDTLFVVARTVHLEDGNGGTRIAYGNTAIFLGRQFIITVRHGSMRSHAPIRQQLEATPWLLKHGPDYVLHAILDFIVDGYFEVIDLVEEQVLVMEDQALESFLNREQTARLFTLRRDLFRLTRILGPMEDLANRFVNIDLPQLDSEIDPYFRDLADHVRRVNYRVAGLRDTLTSVIETSGLLEQQRQGVITRQLAAWAAILAVPTAIAGIYGMNFRFMPELEWRYGYVAVWGVILLVCVTLYVRFKRSGWL
ncbi:magnesium and cobalt transport protein CorA [Sphingorhabdus sp.]|jgi:magnesium transporter|uniref:magnesium and cobalt transport protein CorA n=1 Tax=Sphingorhabdus sp. TaxID=1902408 RepID=UPI003BAEB5FC|nr:magnesium and cobalt transport protein CorA [Sphingomonadales bacterium]MBK9432527.1 magnesium and cobalt transport protein CorA [Sphingomonadales bacterium]